MNLRTLQEKSDILYGRPIAYYLKKASGNYKFDIDIVSNQDIFGSYYVKALGLETVIDILRSRNSKCILYVACDHVSDNMHRIIDYIQDNLPDATILSITGDGSYYELANNTLYYPYYWYAFLPGPQKHYAAWKLDTSKFAQSRLYSASCLNNLCRYHRIKLLDQFVQKPYFQNILYSFNGTAADDHYDLPEMQTLVAKYQNLLPLKIDRKDAKYGDDMLRLDHPGLHDSYLNIVTAHHYDISFLDEKIFKPIATGQIFVTLSGTGTIDLLRKLGFDVFDDIINHDYDNEPDLNMRIDKLVTSIDLWMHMDHETVWQETYSRRVKNAEHFFNLDVSKNPFDQFLKQFDQ
jgi:hypothetical protein